jgi:hypothetical protein
VPKPFRLILIVKANKVNDHKAAAAEIDPGSDSWFTCGLSPTGQEPATHYLTQIVVGEIEVLKYVKKIGNVGEPTDWYKKGKEKQKDWVQKEMDKLGSGHGTFLILNNSEGYQEKLKDLLATAGLEIIY